MFTVHNVFPTISGAIVGGISYLTARQLQSRSFFPTTDHVASHLKNAPKIAELFSSFVEPVVATSVFLALATFFLHRRRVFNKFPVYNFVTLQNATPAAAPLHVGFRHIPGDKAKKRPAMSVFYTTTQDEVARVKKRWVDWTPRRDVRFSASFARFALELSGLDNRSWLSKIVLPVLRLSLRHTTWLQLEAAAGAKVCVEPSRHAPDTLNLGRICIFQGGMVSHTQSHSNFAKAILAEYGAQQQGGGGGIVILPAANDGSTHAYVGDLDDDEVVVHEDGEAMNEKSRQSEKAIAQREAMLERRLDGIDAILQFAADGSDDGLCAKLGMSAAEREQFLDSQSRITTTIASGNNNKQNKKRLLQIVFCGHSFGGSTTVGTCLRNQNRSDEKVVEFQRCIAFDTWMTPLTSTLEKLSGGPAKKEAADQAATDSSNEKAAISKKKKKKKDAGDDDDDLLFDHSNIVLTSQQNNVGVGVHLAGYILRFRSTLFFANKNT